jgi:hypothetical protein
MSSFSATASAFSIPTPDANLVISDEEYFKLYPPKALSGMKKNSLTSPPTPLPSGTNKKGTKQGIKEEPTAPNHANSNENSVSSTAEAVLPRSFIRYSTAIEDAIDGVPYNLDEFDETWLQGFQCGYTMTMKPHAVVHSPEEHASYVSSSVTHTPVKKKSRTKSPVSSIKSPKLNPLTSLGLNTKLKSPHMDHEEEKCVYFSLFQDEFEHIMYILEGLMTERTGWMVWTSGFESELAQTEPMTVDEVMEKLSSRNDLISVPFEGQQRNKSWENFNLKDGPVSKVEDKANGLPSSTLGPSHSKKEPSETYIPELKEEDILNLAGNKVIHAQSKDYGWIFGKKAGKQALQNLSAAPQAHQSLLHRIQFWLPYIYPWWKLRRHQCQNRPIQYTVRIEEPNVRNETDPYVCFRKRELKMTRKTRRTDTQALSSLRKLRNELEYARLLLNQVYQREKLREEYLDYDRHLFETRSKLKLMKRKLGMTEEREWEKPDYALPHRSQAPPRVPKSALVGSSGAHGRAPKGTGRHGGSLAAAPLATPSDTVLGAITKQVQSVMVPRLVSAADDIPSLTELLNRRVEEEFRKRKMAEDPFDDVSLCPRQIFLGGPQQKSPPPNLFGSKNSNLVVTPPATPPLTHSLHPGAADSNPLHGPLAHPLIQYNPAWKSYSLYPTMPLVSPTLLRPYSAFRFASPSNSVSPILPWGYVSADQLSTADLTDPPSTAHHTPHHLRHPAIPPASAPIPTSDTSPPVLITTSLSPGPISPSSSPKNLGLIPDLPAEVKENILPTSSSREVRDDPLPNSMKSPSESYWVYRKRTGRGGRVFLERRCRPIPSVSSHFETYDLSPTALSRLLPS